MSDEVNIVGTKKSKQQTNNTLYKVILGVVGVLVIGGLGFYGGIAYQKNHTTTKTTTASSNGFNGPAGGGGFGGGGRFSGNRGVGTVSAISSSSITIQTMAGDTKTYTITSSTTITDNGQTSSASDIQSGDTVFITTSSSTSTDATRILVNPSFGGFGGGAGQGSSSTTSPSSGT